MIYLTTTPRPLRLLFPRSAEWNGPSHTPEPTVYLTFDDGPHPDVTPQVLQLLEAAGSKATFFCVGENAARYPTLYENIISAGHSVGNHTHRHKNGWKTSAAEYGKDVSDAAAVIRSPLFRPPYGRLRCSQSETLQAAGYRIILWDVLSGDFDPAISADVCYRNATDNTRPGSIIVFHDSIKAAPRMLPALARTIEHFAGQGWAMKALPL